MVDKIEPAAKPADSAGLERGDKGDKNPSLNLVDLKSDQPTKAPDATAGKAQVDSAMKGFPAVEMFDSLPVNDSHKRTANRNSFSEKDTPRYEGNSPWSKLEGFTLATGRPDSPKQAENRSSFSHKDTPRYEGNSPWAKLEGHSLATDNPESPKDKNRKAFNVKEKPRYEGNGIW